MSFRFKDSRGDEWEVPFGVRQVKWLKDRLDIDVDPMRGPEFKAELAKITGSMAGFVDALYVVCHRQAEDRGLSEDEFAERIDLEVFTEAVAAFEGAFLNFFLPRKGRAVALAAVERQQTTLREKWEQAGETAAKTLPDSSSAVTGSPDSSE